MSNSVPPSGGDTSASTVVPVRRGAKAVVSSASRVLLVRERHSDGRPFWTLPGGVERAARLVAVPN